MVLPRKINLVSITFQFIDRTDVILDLDFDEPVGEDVFLSSTTTAEGQVNLRAGPHLRRSNTLTGDEEETLGHLLFRLPDMIVAGLATDNGTDISFELKKGDRITQIASQLVNFEVIEIRPESPLLGDFLLVYIDFKQGGEERTGRAR